MLYLKAEKNLVLANFRMKKITKIMAGLLLAAGLGFGFIGCGSSGGSPPGTATGVATLSWSPPTTSSDGTPLTNLVGYKIYYGTASGKYSSSIDVGNTTTYTLTNLPVGTTSFMNITAYDSTGVESGFSNEVSKSL